MGNLNSVLNERISRIARREIRRNVGTTKKTAAQHRRVIAALKKTIKDLSRRLAVLETISAKTVNQLPVELPEKVRFSARSVASQRRRLGLSADKFGQLVGVTGVTIASWENGKTRPRSEQFARLVSVRGIGKREAIKRLEMLGQSVPAAGGPRRRVRRDQTAEEFVRSLVKGKKAVTSFDINAAWKEDERPGKADNTLSIMVRNGKLTREKLEGKRGSRYSV